MEYERAYLEQNCNIIEIEKELLGIMFPVIQYQSFSVSEVVKVVFGAKMLTHYCSVVTLWLL